MVGVQEWLEDKVRGYSSDSPSAQRAPALAAVEQLARAWKGLSGKGGLVFGMSDSAAWMDADVESVKHQIVHALEAWLRVLEVEDAAAVVVQFRIIQLSLEVPDAVRAQADALEEEANAAKTPPRRRASPEEVEAIRLRLAELDGLVSEQRWNRLVSRLERLSRFVQQSEETGVFEEVEPLVIKPLMNVSDIADVQTNLDRPIPDELLFVAATFSGGVKLGWEYNFEGVIQDVEFPVNRLLEGRVGLTDCSVGLFDLYDMPNLLGCRDWELDGEVTEWSTVLPILQLESDYVAVRTDDLSQPSVVYMSHEENCRMPPLGASFMDFFERWAALNLVDLETYAYSPLMECEEFNDDAPAFKTWRSWWRTIGWAED